MRLIFAFVFLFLILGACGKKSDPEYKVLLISVSKII